MVDASDSEKNVSAVGMVTIKAMVPNYENFPKVADLDFLLVVDKSFTMRGNRIETLKKLMFNFINHLLENNHRLGIVTFDSKVNRILELTYATNHNKEIASKALNTIETMGKKNTFEGLLTGLKMAYDGGKRACVLLFTDGNPSCGKWTTPHDILREIKTETMNLVASSPTSKVVLHTFGIFGNPASEELLLMLSEGIGNGNYHKVDKNTELGSVFARIVSKEISKVATDLQIVISPSTSSVEIKSARRKFGSYSEGRDLIIKIQSMANQQSLHIPIDFTVLPTKEEVNYEEVFHVNMTYTNLITENTEWCNEYLYVARTRKLEKINERVDVKEQLIRVEVAEEQDEALRYIVKYSSREDALKRLKEAENTACNSISKNDILSMCLCDELAKLISMFNDNSLTLTKVQKILQESSSSHWDETGGWNSCYMTRNQETMISIFTRSRTLVYEYYEFYELVIRKCLIKHE